MRIQNPDPLYDDYHWKWFLEYDRLVYRISFLFKRNM
jgi:hypothetical protein